MYHNAFKIDSWHHNHYSEGGLKICGCYIISNNEITLFEYLSRLNNCEPRKSLSLFQARNAAIEKMIQDKGPRAFFVPSFDHPHIIAGQGSIALELLEQVTCLLYTVGLERLPVCHYMLR